MAAAIVCGEIRISALTRRNGRTASAKLLDAAQTAPGRTGKITAPLVERRPLRRCDRYAKLDAIFAADDVNALDLLCSGDDPFAETKTDREVFQVQRTCHHHGVGRGVINHRHRRLFGNNAIAAAARFAAPAVARHATDRPHRFGDLRVNVHCISTTAPPLAMLTGMPFEAGTLLPLA